MTPGEWKGKGRRVSGLPPEEPSDPLEFALADVDPDDDATEDEQPEGRGGRRNGRRAGKNDRRREATMGGEEGRAEVGASNPQMDLPFGDEPAPPPTSLWQAVGATLVALAAAVGVAWAARQYVTTSPRFAIADIQVTGAHRRSEDEVARQAGVDLGMNVFSVDLDGARARLLSDPWLKDASLSRHLPGTIRIDVAEHEPFAIVALPDAYVVPRDGTLIKRVEQGDPTDLPVVSGIGADALWNDKEGATKAILLSALQLIAEVEGVGLPGKARLQQVHVAPDGTMTLAVGQPVVTIALGAPPFRRKLEQAARVLSELDRQSARPEAILLDNESRPDRVVVRMR